MEEIKVEIDKFKEEKEKEKILLEKQKITSPFKQRSRRYLLNANTVSPSNSQVVYSHLHLGSPNSNLKNKLSSNMGEDSNLLLGPRNFSLAPNFKFDISNDVLPPSNELPSPQSKPQNINGLHIISMSIKQPEALTDMRSNKNSQVTMKQTLNTDSHQ